METRVEENVQASALVFAAIESQRTGAAGQARGIQSLRAERDAGRARLRKET